jgi:hypothetical protein
MARATTTLRPEKVTIDGIVLDAVETMPKHDGRGRWYTPEKPTPYDRARYISGGRDERGNKVRVYVSVRGESVLDNFADRYSRPTKVYRKFLPAALAAAGIDRDAKAVWNQRAGCSCGCSPAFVVDARTGFDIWITLVGDEKARIDPAKADVAEWRAAQIGAQIG